MPKPSDYKQFPFGSVSQNSETETVALNIMIILSRTGDIFRPLTWAEYKSERSKNRDSDAVDREHGYFNDALPYCKSPITAARFADAWMIEDSKT